MSTFEPQPLRSMASGFEPLSRSPDPGVVPPSRINGSYRCAPHHTKTRSPVPNGRSQAYLAETQRNIAHLTSLLNTNSNQQLSSRTSTFPSGRLRMSGIPLLPLHGSEWNDDQQHNYQMPAHHHPIQRQISGQSKHSKYSPNSPHPVLRNSPPSHQFIHPPRKEPMVFQPPQVGLRHFRSSEQSHPAVFHDPSRYPQKDFMLDQNPAIEKNSDTKGRCVLCQCISYRLEESARNVPLEIHKLASNELPVDPHMGIVGKWHGVCHEKGGSCLPGRFQAPDEGSRKSEEKTSPETSRDNAGLDTSSIISQCSTDVPGSSLALSSCDKSKRFTEFSAANSLLNGRRNSEPWATSRWDGIDYDAMNGDGDDNWVLDSRIVPSRIRLPLGREFGADFPIRAKGDNAPGFSVSTYHKMEAASCWPFDYVLFPPMICTDTSLTTALHPSSSV